MVIPSGTNHLFPLTKSCIQKEREACKCVPAFDIFLIFERKLSYLDHLSYENILVCLVPLRNYFKYFVAHCKSYHLLIFHHEHLLGISPVLSTVHTKM